MRVLIADGLALFRRGLKETLAEAFSKVTFGEARTAQEALDHVHRRDWDVVILDMKIPGGGLGVLDDLKRLRPKLPILLLSMYPEQFARPTLESSAAGCLTKNCSPDELKEAIERHNRLRRQGAPSFQGTSLEDLGHYLVDARIASNLTQQELADKAIWRDRKAGRVDTRTSSLAAIRGWGGVLAGRAETVQADGPTLGHPANVG